MRSWMLAFWVTACASTAPPQGAAPSEAWLGMPAYPGARRLCSQHVTGTGMHILWTAYASSDPIERVRSFYEREHGSVAVDGSSFSVRATEDDVLSVHPIGASYPTCEVSPLPSDRTYFVVSRAVR